jgi:S1-C subfamily serine protease
MKPKNLTVILASAFVGAVLAVFLLNQPIAFLAASQAQSPAVSAGQPLPANKPPAPVYTPEELANIRVYELANKSVVNITTSTVQYDRFRMLPIPGEGSGSGSILDKEGHILTNAHVIDGARKVEVTLADGSIHDATLVGADTEYDIAVLKIDAPPENLVPIRLGRSDNLRVGQRTYLVGNPFGLNGTLTTGIISSLDRSLPSQVEDREMTSIIQTDAAMNPGNSGGPMLDSSARMIGMNVAIATRTGQSAGVGFAIPVDRIRRFLPDLIEHGRIIRPFHGIVSVMETKRGLRIVKLSNDGPAERAGLRGFRIVQRQVPNAFGIATEQAIDRSTADVLIAIDGKELKDHTDFVEIMERHKPGETVKLTILRNGSLHEVELTLGAA